MELTHIEIKLKNIAFLLGVLQGLAYAVMALICIILYNKDEINFNLSSRSYMDTVQQNMYYMFLSPSDRTQFDYSLKPHVFTGFVWVYFFLHLGWIGVSVEASRKRGVTLPKYLTAWSHLTLLISVWDFITVVILGSDYHKCLDWAYTYPSLAVVSLEGACSTGMLPVLVIAAKGFVLWIVNVIFAIVLQKMAKDLKAGQVFSQPVAAPPLVFQAQHVPVSPQPNVYQTSPQPTGYPVNPHPFAYAPQPPKPAPNVAPPLQNVPRNGNNFPVSIPEPDYHYNQQRASRY